MERKPKRQILGEGISMYEETENVGLDGKENPFFKISLKKNSACRYKITTEQFMVANGKKLADISTLSTWKIQIQEVYGEGGFIVYFDVESHDVFNKTAGVEKIIEFTKIYSRPAESIILKLNNSGEIVKVLSQNEIFDKWNKIKNNEFKEYLNDVTMKGIIEAGDNDFFNSLPLLKNNINYFLFFDNVYNKTSSTFEDFDLSFPSKLFHGKSLSFKRKQKVSKIDQQLNLRNEFTLNQKQDLSINEAYQVNYKNIIKDDMNLFADCNSNATYNTNSGFLSLLDAKMVEKVNDNLFYETTLKIESLN